MLLATFRVRSISLEQIGAHIADLRMGAPVVLICKSGQRAGATAQLLKAHHPDVLVLDGGTRAWRESGGQIVLTTRTGWLVVGTPGTPGSRSALVLVGVVLSLI
jgi:3-mercaptopyruvate sulfurtransferase SseA